MEIKTIFNYAPDPVFNFLLKIRGKLGPNPFREYNHQFRCIFIHIPKTGGQSIYQSLFETKRSHIDLKYFEAHNPRLFNEYFKFAFVRNPYSRLVSSFFYTVQAKDHNLNWVNKDLKNDRDFPRFLSALNQSAFRQKVLTHPNFRPQHKFVTNLNGNVALDYTGRFENIGSDFEFLSDKLSIVHKLAHRNKSDHESPENYFNPDSLKLINDMYAIDFEIFGYSKM